MPAYVGMTDIQRRGLVPALPAALASGLASFLSPEGAIMGGALA
ncbi:hypothetical protein EP837_02340 [Sphingobium sp. EP60837]|jgi:hypothetical protein|nr:hypothetical protein EP837_02340 [Sphingobium sp. EP60837]